MVVRAVGAIVAIVALGFGSVVTPNSLADHFHVALPDPVGHLPSPIHLAGWSYETTGGAGCLSRADLDRYFHSQPHESWPLTQVGTIPVLFSWHLSYPILRPRTSPGWQPMVLYVQRGAQCYQAYGVEGLPN